MALHGINTLIGKHVYKVGLNIKSRVNSAMWESRLAIRNKKMYNKLEEQTINRTI